MSNEVPTRSSVATVATAEFLKRGCVAPIDIEFRNITYTVMHGPKRETKVILKGVSGKFQHGSVTAIMGPSGAGKSSLMNVLAGYRTHNVAGEVYVNRKQRDMEAFRKLACYIMQDDRLIEELTAYESLVYSAHLKLATGAVSQSERTALINEILELMGISQCAQTRVAKLSGGQRKRLSIALELVQNTPILFLDEPTTGLDSVSCYQCVSMLQKLARGGRTVVCTIHQPSAKIFELFDELYFVGNGECIYDGPVRTLVPYLRRHGLLCPSYHNPADFMMEIAVSLHGQESLERLKTTIRERETRKQTVITRSQQTQQNDDTTSHKVQERSSACSRIVAEIRRVAMMLIGEGLHSRLQNSRSADEHCNLHDLRPSQQLNDSKTLINSRLSETGFNSCDSQHSNNLNEDESANATAGQFSLSTILEVQEISNDGSRMLPDRPMARCASDRSDSLQRLHVLLRRTGLCLWRDGMLSHIRWVSAALFGFIVGLLFYNTGKDGHRVSDIGSCLLFHGMFIIYVTIMTNVLRLPLETLLVIKEHLNGWYNVHTYFWARMLVDLPLQVAVPVIYSTIVYYMTGLPAEPTRYIMFIGVMLVSTFCATSFAYFLSAICSVQSALYIAPMMSTPQLLFSGYFLPLGSIPAFLKWISYTSFVRFAFSAIIASLYGPLEGVPPAKFSCEPAQAKQCVEDASKLIEMFGMQHSNYLVDCLVLLAYSVLFRILCYFVLRHRVKTR